MRLTIPSLELRLSFVGGKDSLVHTDCACANIYGKFSVKLSGHYKRTRGSCTYTTVSGEYTETNESPMEKKANRWFLKDYDVYMKQRS